ncbi:hypothetical protein HA402_006340 [Bradysia odoriphaga]|nr:hypothetical protein HA402_006340 [Bradysia odoriphaga]
MNSSNHKTVFVLDHTQYFGISGEDYLDLDFGKNKGNAIPLPPISKSLWTCSVESSAEYCRIVWDLFPAGKLIRFVVSDSNAHIVNTWAPGTQNLTHVLNAMAMVGIPPRIPPQSSDYSVIHGLRAAVEAISEPTEQQKELLLHGKLNSKMFTNKGRVICITSARDDASMKSLEDIFHTVIVQQNALSAAHKELMPIDHCHLVIINLYPSNMESMVNDRGQQEISPLLSTEIHSVKASDISNKLTHLILPHYDLASTTVTGIPMKEEQNASSSANYDVEIFHSSNAHSVILGTELLLPTSMKEGSKYETVTLKWCTPRGLGASDMQPCLAQHRVTPVDVTSRPSSCLINFLLNGRSVLLEMPRKSGGKLTSHLLSAHGGEIFIHTLHIARSCLEDPPSILEGGGGKVTDYRITDFGALIQNHRLFPLKVGGDRPPDENLGKVRSRLQKHTKYWPLTLGTTVLYNVRQFIDPILNVTNKDVLTEEEIVQCQQVIYSIVALEARHEPLALPIGHRLKGNKKEEQYRLLWAELETLLIASSKSPGHMTILQCIRDCRSRGGDQSADKVELDQALRELESLGDSSKRLSVIKATTDSPMSPPLSGDSTVMAKMKNPFGGTGNRSLLDIFTAAERAQSQKRIDFAGRLCTPINQIAKLYPNLGVKENVPRETDVK